jgi:phosphorylcholine metabolism protein LicD
MFERNIYQRAATPCLKDAAKVLDALGVNWWCEAGTCLGIVREKDFIAHDSDIDIGTTDWERHEEIYRAFIEAGFWEVHTYGKPDDGLEYAFSKHGVKIDIFFFYKAGNKLCHSAWLEDKQLFYDFPKSYIEPTQRAKFVPDHKYGVIFVNLPHDTNAYLTARYGDWNKVNKDWRWDIDPLCLRK